MSLALAMTCLVQIGDANSANCCAKDAVRADAMVDRLTSWQAVDVMMRRFGHCDEGSIAEGISEAIARLLVDRPSSLQALATYTRRSPRLLRFVQRHLNATLDTSDLEAIRRRAMACPRAAEQTCIALRGTIDSIE